MTSALSSEPRAGFRRYSRSARAVATVLAAAVLLAACADMSGIHTRAQMRGADSLGLPPVTAATASASDAAALFDAAHAQWWQALGDDRLNALVDQALQGSPSIRMAQARLDKAWAQTQVIRAADLPQIQGDVEATRQRYTANGAVPSPLAGSIQNSALAQLSLGWELDLFGRNRAALESAIGAARAAQADAQAARVLLASQVVQNYVQLARLQAQLAVSERALAQRNETLAIVKSRFEAGLDTRLEVRQSEGGLPETRTQIEQLREQATLTRNALAALLGQPGQASQIVATDLSQLRLPVVPQSLPASLLGRRADVVASRWRVEAAQQSIAEAKARFYPDINLSAFVGFSSLGFNHWLDASSRQWGVGPAITLPIFEGGRLRANLRGTSADYDAAVERYNQSVIDAVHDVADQLASVTAVGRQQTEQMDATATAQSAYDIARQRYAAGLGNYLSVLSAETNVLAQQRLSVDLAARALQTRVALVHALGGGYTEAEAPTAADTTPSVALRAPN